MLRTFLAFSAIAFAAAPVAASNYAAKPAAAATTRFITGDITWNCDGAGCRGATEESRPLVLCQSLAKRAGRIDSFLVDGRAFDAAELQKCNAAAKAQPAKALAAQ